MKKIDLIAEVDEEINLQAELPAGCPPGPVRVVVFVPEPDLENEWMQLIAREWQAELGDSREDVYSLEDGEPLDASG